MPNCFRAAHNLSTSGWTAPQKRRKDYFLEMKTLFEDLKAGLMEVQAFLAGETAGFKVHTPPNRNLEDEPSDPESGSSTNEPELG